MTVETIEFYIPESLKYLATNNEEFLDWYMRKKTNDSYHSLLTLKEVDKMVQKITNWYEIKYPDRILEMIQIKDQALAYLKDISKELNFEQLKLRLTKLESQVLSCHYRDKSITSSSHKKYIKIPIKIEQSEPFIILASELGIVEKRHLSKLEEILAPSKGNITIGKILEELKNIPFQEVDIYELEECIRRRQIDLELRDRIMSLVSLSILYSKNTTFEYGYSRAYKFIQEYNEYYNRNLSIEELDILIQRNQLSKKRIKVK